MYYSKKLLKREGITQKKVREEKWTMALMWRSSELTWTVPKEERTELPKRTEVVRFYKNSNLFTNKSRLQSSLIYYLLVDLLVYRPVGHLVSRASTSFLLSVGGWGLQERKADKTEETSIDSNNVQRCNSGSSNNRNSSISNREPAL